VQAKSAVYTGYEDLIAAARAPRPRAPVQAVRAPVVEEDEEAHTRGAIAQRTTQPGKPKAAVDFGYDAAQQRTPFVRGHFGEVSEGVGGAGPRLDFLYPGQSHEVNSILHLQRTIGNQAVQRLLQADAEESAVGSAGRLAISKAGDKYEQEADRIAEQVVGMPAPQLQRTARAITPLIRANGSEGATANDVVTDRIASTRGGGSPLPESSRSFMESRFGMDFSQVRIHTGDYASQLSRDLNAKAFTVGSDIYFKAGNFSPESSEGRYLLAHELTHTVQQGAAQQGAVEQSPTASRHTWTLAAPMLQCSFEDEPVSSGNNADTLVTRIQGILREWKSECQEGVNDFVHAELAAAIDGLASGSWPTFLLALVGNTIWAATAFVPPIAGARVVFAVSMAGIGVAAAPTIPAASSEGENLTRVAELMKDYYGNVFTQLLNQVGPRVTTYVRAHGQITGNQALISFLQNTFQPEQINTTGTPNINGNRVRTTTHAYASNLLARYRQQVVPIGPATVTNVTDPIDRQITTQTGLVWAERDGGSHYLTQIFIENSSIGGSQRGTTIRFRTFIDDVLKDAAIERARRSQPRGIQTLPWSAIRGIPDRVPPSAARE
jgi:hypothetical protein